MHLVTCEVAGEGYEWTFWCKGTGCRVLDILALNQKPNEMPQAAS